MDTPFEQIKKKIIQGGTLPDGLTDNIPRRWEKIGDVLIIKLAPHLQRYRREIGRVYAEVLHCKTVLQEKHGISGVYREPHLEIIYGDKNTETIHMENRIRYMLDPQKIMFSSGNMDERIRMSRISKNNEIIVDLFAGIGYFTLPLAVYSRPQHIYACEINPLAYKYLCKNIVLNDVTTIVEPLLGDNRNVAPRNVADRIIMGYIKDTHTFLPTAFNCLKDKGGVIHYHEVLPNELLPDHLKKKLIDIAQKHNKKIRFLKYRHIKSYSPGVTHVVMDLLIKKI